MSINNPALGSAYKGDDDPTDPDPRTPPPPPDPPPLDPTKRGPGPETRPTAPPSWQWGNDEVQALLNGLDAGQSGQSWLDAYNTNFGLKSGSSLAYYADSNTYALPSGYATLGANGQWTWNPRTGNAAPSGPSIPPSSFSSTDAARQQQADALFQLLMGQASQSLNISADDPIIKGQVDAYASKAADQWRNTASAMAEKGGANANTEAEQRSVGEKLSKGTADFQSQLMGRELQSRRDQISQALTQAAGLLTAEQQMALQDELARLDAMIGVSEFSQSMAERAYEFDATVNP